METDSRVWLKKKFKKYYWDTEVSGPSEIHRREFGVGTLDDKIKFRHKSFSTDKKLNQYLRTEAPYYISYSAAYYEFPEQPMQSKNWLGADLIFDLDKQMDYLNAEKLTQVKDEALNILDFLGDDFGFLKSDIRVNFSGSKGYHIHVFSEDVRSLSAESRRQIIEYISGADVDVEKFMRFEDGNPGLKYSHGRQVGVGGKWLGPTPDSRGWAKRIYDAVEEILKMPREELENIDGIGAKTAEKIVAGREKNLKHLRAGRWNAFWDDLRPNVKKQIQKRAVKVTDDDKQVTADISRLIRLPDTIHGGSGLLAKTVKRIESFNPLTEAVAFRGEDAKIRLTKDVSGFDLMENRWGPYTVGQEIVLPEYACVYLILKDKADAV